MALTCEISENMKVIKFISTDTCTEPGDLLESLEKFRQTVNETITNMIEENGEVDDYVNDDAESSADESFTVAVSPKKKKK